MGLVHRRIIRHLGDATSFLVSGWFLLRTHEEIKAGNAPSRLSVAGNQPGSSRQKR